MRSLETPLVLHELQLFRLGSYLKSMPVLDWVFAPQEQPTKLYVETDSDWAQCPRTRRSTGGGMLFWENTCWRATVASKRVWR